MGATSGEERKLLPAQRGHGSPWDGFHDYRTGCPFPGLKEMARVCGQIRISEMTIKGKVSGWSLNYLGESLETK